MYAQIINGEIASIGRLPKSARRIDTGEWVMGLETAPAELLEACGYFAYAETERPADTETDTHDRTVEVVDGRPAVVWTPRPKPEPELSPPVVLTTEEKIIAALETIEAPMTTADVIDAILAALTPTEETP